MSERIVKIKIDGTTQVSRIEGTPHYDGIKLTFEVKGERCVIILTRELLEVLKETTC